MHRHHRHPEEVNEERFELLQKKRRIWSKEEDEHLLGMVNDEWREGMLKKDHLALLQVNFTHRSINSIKKRLQHLGWTPSQNIQQQPALSMTVSPQINTLLKPAKYSATTTPASHRSPPETASTLTPAPQRTNWTSKEDVELQAQANRIWRPDMLKKDLAKSLVVVNSLYYVSFNTIYSINTYFISG